MANYWGVVYLSLFVFLGLVSLRTLDLSHNQLDKIANKTHGLLDDCLSLERVNFSNNKISFITRKTFPSDPYIPYKLKDIDLSHNAMPVITYELTIGTKKVEKLNLSANSITEIRNGVIGNLTSLSVLDLSRNQLSSLKGIFEKTPRNLTKLFLSDNRLSELPENLKRMNLTVLDVHNNDLRVIPYSLQPLIENNSAIIFNGNPLPCDCFLRPLRRWLTRNLHHSNHWDHLLCNRKESAHTVPISSLTESELNCNDRKQDSKEPFGIMADLKFRDVAFKSNGMITINWLVTSNVDIADFYLFLQKVEQENSPAVSIFEKLIAYTERRYVLSTADLREFMREGSVAKWDKSDFKLCIVAVDSLGTPRDFTDNQCMKVPYTKVKNLLTSSANFKSCNVFLTGCLILLTLKASNWLH